MRFAAAALLRLQQRPKLSYVLHAFDPEHALDQCGRGRDAEHRGDEIAAFGDDLLARHRVVGSAADGRDMLARDRTVGERHLDDRFAARRAALELLVGPPPDLRRLALYGPV